MKLWRILGILAVALCVNATAHASKRSKHVRPRTVTMYFKLVQDRTSGAVHRFCWQTHGGRCLLLPQSSYL